MGVAKGRHIHHPLAPIYRVEVISTRVLYHQTWKASISNLIGATLTV